MGWLQRIRDEKDERALNIKLTEQGEALRKEAAKVGPCVAEACGMPIPELVALKAKLEELRTNLLASEKIACALIVIAITKCWKFSFCGRMVAFSYCDN